MRGKESGKSSRPSMGNGWNAGVHACASGKVEAGFSGRDAASSM